MSDTAARRLRSTVALVIIVASLVVIGIGFQAELAAKDNARRDHAIAADTRQRAHALAAQHQKDTAYANCLNNFAADLASTLVTIRKANARLATAQDEKDAALDDVLLAVAGARHDPPTATSQDFGAALDRFVKTKDHVDRVKAATNETKAENPYPEAKCTR
jgi:hypothetical protein